MEGAQYPVLPLSIHDALSALVASARSSVPGGSAYPRGNAFLTKNGRATLNISISSLQCPDFVQLALGAICFHILASGVACAIGEHG